MTSNSSDDRTALSRVTDALLQLSSASSAWNAAEPQSIAEDLGLAVLQSLQASFAYVQLRGPGGVTVELVRTPDGVQSGSRATEIGAVLAPLTAAGDVPAQYDIPGRGTLRLARAPIGIGGDCGFVAAGSPNADFPGTAGQFFLTFAANQVAVVLQHHVSEYELFQSEERFARFMQNLPGLAWIKDIEGRYVYANHEAEKAFRRSSAQLLGKTDDEVFPPETAARFRENDRRAIALPSGLQVIESLMHDDGVLHHSVVSKFPIPGKDGVPALIGGVAFDITDRIQAEKTAVEASRQKDAFFAVLGHELRNPLSPMLTAVQLLRLRGTDGREIEILERQLTHMRRLVDDLLDVSRITSGKVQLHLEDVDVASIFVRTLDTVGPLLEQRHHHLHVRIPRGRFGVRADPERLTQVMTNLLVNAAKYSDEGSNIHVEATADGGFVRLAIRDEGMGIAPDLLDTIFDTFVQRPEGLDRSRDGLGLGLAIVRSLVRQHGGRVTARSDGPGKGSEFVVELPEVTLADEAPTQPTPASTRALRHRTRVLIVDDNRDAAETLNDALELHGFDARVACVPDEAIRIAVEFRPAVALLDIGMPQMSGHELARQLRSRVEPGRTLRLVALTGFGQPADRERALSAGFDLHLVKPVEIRTLVRTLEELQLGANTS